MALLLLTAAPALFSLLLAGLGRYLQTKWQGWLLSLLMLSLFGLLLTWTPEVLAQGSRSYVISWMPALGIDFSLYLDGLSLLFALLITGIGAVVMLYAGYYFDEPHESARFLSLLLLFSAAMLTLVLAGNLITLFVAWELTSVISFLLISFKGEQEAARAGAAQALLITGVGGLALLLGLLLMAAAAGSSDLPSLLSQGDMLRSHPWYPGIAILIMAGAFSKSAQFPLHFWLPGAMSAPTPASAYLHSATMVKAGIYLLVRFYPLLGETPQWETGLIVTGLLTLLVASVQALWQRDLKGILAYTTAAQLGALVALIGLPESAGIKAAMVGVIGHALYKGALFLVAGAVDHSTGTRNIDELGGLSKLLPGLAVLSLIASLSMAGVPPLLGFVAKETLLEALIDQPFALGIVVISAILTAAIAARLYWDLFQGEVQLPRLEEPHRPYDSHHPLGDDAFEFSHVHRLPWPMLAGPWLLAGGSILAGLFVGPILAPLISTVVGESITLYLLPPYFNLALGLSLTALAAGLGVFALRRAWLPWNPRISGLGPRAYRAMLGLLDTLGDLLLRVQGGKIRYYLLVIFAAVLLLLSTVLGSEFDALRGLEIRFSGAGDLLKGALLLIALGTTLASILFERHLLAALSLSVAGYAIGGLFLLEPAPDVALVQFLVETLATVLIVIILARSSEEERQRAIAKLWDQSRGGLLRDIVISVGAGLAVALFALAAVSGRGSVSPVAQWHLENALPQAAVSDVVAAIITDFRGMDTLIEIVVFSVAALGVLTLLARPRRMEDRVVAGEAQDAITLDSQAPDRLVYRSRFDTPVTRLAALLALPLGSVLAFSQLLYAGAGPGDGFTAGVIMGLVVALWYVVFGYEEVRSRLIWLRPALLIALGLGLALINALLPLALGRPFLAFTLLPFSFADVKFASTLVFEVGIFLAVFGGVSMIMEAISHPREVEAV